MIDSEDEFKNIFNTAFEIIKADNLDILIEVLHNCDSSLTSHYDNWNGGTYYYTLYLTVTLDIFVKYRAIIKKIETDLLEKFEMATRHYDNESISGILVVPKSQNKIDWSKINGLITKDKLLQEISYLKNTMISVSTGGQRIQDVNDKYITSYAIVDKPLKALNITNTNQFKDLWEWYGKWSSEFKTYQERRSFIGEIYNNLIKKLEDSDVKDNLLVTVDLNDWERIERSVNEIKLRISNASTEEQFQVIGLLARETIISLAQGVFILEKHPIIDGTIVSKTDAKRMLEAYIAVELAGSSNEALRKFARATLDLANELTHKRTATKTDANLCATATLSLINLFGILEGRD